MSIRNTDRFTTPGSKPLCVSVVGPVRSEVDRGAFAPLPASPASRPDRSHDTTEEVSPMGTESESTTSGPTSTVPLSIERNAD